MEQVAGFLQSCSEHKLLLTLWSGHLVLEYWLGKTKKTKSASVLELIVIASLQLVILVTKKKEKKNGN